jgi:hypothetical protein
LLRGRRMTGAWRRFVPFLLDRGVRVALLHGRCPDEFLDAKLTKVEATSYRQAQAADHSRSRAQSQRSIAIEHAEP